MGLTVMPVIKVSSVSGSNSPNASGAGPNTPVAGTNAAHTNGISNTIIYFTNSPDLSGIAQDGSHVLYLETASGRRFTRISTVDDVAKSCIVQDTFNIPAGTPVSYAIGGMLSSLFGTGYERLTDGSGSYDAKSGWTIEFQNGHEETISAPTIRVSGDSVFGRFTICGVEGASTRPKITISGNSLTIASSRATMENFDIVQSKSNAVYAVYIDSVYNLLLRRMKVSSSGALKASYGISLNTYCVVESCEVFNVNNGILSTLGDSSISNCYFHDCTSTALAIGGANYRTSVDGNVFVDCGTGLSSASNARLERINGNVFDSCGTGINQTGSLATGSSNGSIRSNIFTNCTFGLYFTNSSFSELYAISQISGSSSNNCYWNNGTHIKFYGEVSTPGKIFLNDYVASAEPYKTLTKAARKAAGDWRLNENEAGKGFPSFNVGFLELTKNHQDPGINLEFSSGGGASSFSFIG